MLMVMLMMVTAAALLTMLMVMLMMMVLVVMLQLLQLLLEGALALHGLQQLCSGQLIPRGNHQRCVFIVFSQHGHSRVQFFLRDGIGAGENDGVCRFDLVVVELAKILHIDLHLAGIHNSNLVSQHHIVLQHLLHSSHHIGQLTHAGGLDHNSVRMVLLDHLVQRFAKVAHQRAANTAGIHLRDVDARILQKTAVNADLAKLIFNQNQLLTLVSLLDHLLDQSRLTGT